MKRVLVVESDESVANRLLVVLKAAGIGAISLVPTVREACLVLTQQTQELALIPLVEAHKQARSLRAIQPDLRLVLLAETEEAVLAAGDAAIFQGLVHKPCLEKNLPAALAEAWQRPVPETLRPAQPDFEAFCRQAALGRQTLLAVVSQGARVLACCGELGTEMAQMVALRADKSWSEEERTALIQFARLADMYDTFLLYTRPVLDSYLLTVGAPWQTPVAEVRRQADELAELLVRVAGRRLSRKPRRRDSAATPAGEGSQSQGRSYAIAWQPVKPLPAALQTTIREDLARLAGEHGCGLSYLAVQPEFVHLVVACPPGRNAAWAVVRLKEGTEKAIQAKYATPAVIWTKGYYAKESSEPLTEAELNLFELE